MLITLSRRAAICQSVSEVELTGVAPLGAVSHRMPLFALDWGTFDYGNTIINTDFIEVVNITLFLIDKIVFIHFNLKLFQLLGYPLSAFGISGIIGHGYLQNPNHSA